MDDSSAFSDSSESGFVSISKLAVIALLLAIFSCIAIISVSLAAVSIASVILSAIASVRIARDPQLGGSGVALAGIAIGCLTGAWSISAARQMNQKLYDVASTHAKTYLDAIGSGATFEAMEMRKEEHQREITGANLGMKYGGESEVKDALEEFLSEPGTKLIQESGSGAEWELAKGLKTQQTAATHKIMILMQNAKKPSEQIVVTLLRRLVPNEDGDVALWHIIDHAALN